MAPSQSQIQAPRGSDIEAALARTISVALLGIVSGIWFVGVNQAVLEPYLDEFFHVRQAIEYWLGHWDVWDPKITTPPGLYVVSLPWLLLLHRSKLPASLLTQLRSVNQFIGIPGIFKLVPTLLSDIYTRELHLQSTDDEPVTAEHAGWVWATARNIAFFPPLFFFSALYYTDVLSVLTVLCCYASYYRIGSWSVLPVGIISLFFRQNNIFWTAIYLAGLEVVAALETDDSEFKGPLAYGEIPGVIAAAWNDGKFYDPSVDVAGLEDYAVSIMTLAIAALVNLPRLIPRLLPYVSLLGLFGAFVLWNGGVVLGDKSNHVASLHLPQMLYIWAYTAFFSFPILLLAALSKFATAFNAISTSKASEKSSLMSSVTLTVPRPVPILLAFGAAIAAVHFNTIVHPFTLADNRHYTFYVFRLLLRPHPYIRFAAVPIYLGCAWAALSALGSAKGTEQLVATSTSHDFSKASGKTSKIAMTKLANRDTITQGNRVSFVIIWLISSALGLITAPLVEPRYFILPWIIWRLHVPPTRLAVPSKKAFPSSTSTSTSTLTSKSQSKSKGTSKAKTLNPNSASASTTSTVTGKANEASSFTFTTGLIDNLANLAKWTPMIETVWLLAINAGTMYVFLYWGFEWAQEPGRVQRFMW